jgi:hypothetical protein
MATDGIAGAEHAWQKLQPSQANFPSTAPASPSS